MTDRGRAAYAAAGVDVEAGDRAVELMRASVEGTRRAEVLGVLGGFGSAVTIPPGYREPVLVSSTDGVGTKTEIARALGVLDTIGIDLVAMCADDVVCSGAEPLFFLDYVAVGRLEPERVAQIVAGVAAGCRMAGCALVGGETAEHPGVMADDQFDLAGFCVGIVERADLIDGSAARQGDAIVGLPAPGLHANGFSLVRALIADGRLALADDLLAPTRIYAPTVLRLRAALRAAGHDVHGVAHVTGGGLPGNVARPLPEGLGARVDPDRWEMPAVMGRIGTSAGMTDRELRATFNGGIGMTLVVPREAVGVVGVTAPDAVLIGEVVTVPEGDPRYVEAPLA